MNLQNKKWLPFLLKDIFDTVYMSKSSDSGNLEEGNIPFIGRSSNNNGYENDYDISVSKINNSPAITVSLIGRSTAFYQEFNFATSQNILVLRHSKLNKKNGMFLVTSINNYLKHFIDSYGLPGSLKRMSNAKLMLPVKNDESPDWDFMEKYVLAKLNKIGRAYTLPEFHNIDDNRKLNEVDWSEFTIDSLGKIIGGKDWDSYSRISGLSPFVGSSSSNNGVTDYVDIHNRKSQVGKGVIGINRNGSVGYAFYHPYSAYFSGDTRFVKINNFEDNKFINLFITTMIMKQKDKYAFGYKMGTARIKRQIIKLPAKNGKPDFVFMEQYMKRIENKIILNIRKID